MLKSWGTNCLRFRRYLHKPINGSGYNEEYGLLGSNTASEDTLKLFPRDGQKYVEAIQARLKELTEKC